MTSCDHNSDGLAIKLAGAQGSEKTRTEYNGIKKVTLQGGLN
jgi:hypothetical protein